MKCPHCHRELRRSRKDPYYGLCDYCRKKYPWHDSYEDNYEEEDYQDKYNLDEYEESHIPHHEPVHTKHQEEAEKVVYVEKPVYIEREPAKKSGGGLSIFFVIIAVILVVVGIFIYMQSRDNGSLGQTIKDDIHSVEDVLEGDIEKGVDDVKDVIKEGEEKLEGTLEETLDNSKDE